MKSIFKVLLVVAMVGLATSAYAVPCTAVNDAGFSCTSTPSGTSFLQWTSANVSIGLNIGTVDTPSLINYGSTTDGQYGFQFGGPAGDPTYFSLQQQAPTGTLPGAFTDGDNLLYDTGDMLFFAINPSVTQPCGIGSDPACTASSPDVNHIGFALQSLWNDDSYHYPVSPTVTVAVYGAPAVFSGSTNIAGAPTGSTDLLGTFTAAMDQSNGGSAPYFGFNTTTAILGFSIFIDAGGDGPQNAFALDTLDIGFAANGSQPTQPDGPGDGSVPEPGTLVLLGSGVAALIGRARR